MKKTVKPGTFTVKEGLQGAKQPKVKPSVPIEAPNMTEWSKTVGDIKKDNPAPKKA